MVKKQAATKPTSYHRFVIGLGYTLFAFMVISVVLDNVIPMTHVLTSPHVRVVNAVVLLVSLVVGALLPAILAYVFGDSSTRVKNRQFHHYNGIMFAVLAYWVNLVVNQFDSGLIIYVRSLLPIPVDMAIGFSIPVVITALIVSIVAYFYHKEKGRQMEISNYRPFQITLFVAVAALLVGAPLQQLVSGVYGFWDLWVSTIIMIVIVLISYACLWGIPVGIWRKLTLAVTCLTFTFVTVFVVGQLQENIYSSIGNLRSVPAVTIILASLLVWSLYLYVARLSYRK